VHEIIDRLPEQQMREEVVVRRARAAVHHDERIPLSERLVDASRSAAMNVRMGAETNTGGWWLVAGEVTGMGYEAWGMSAPLHSCPMPHASPAISHQPPATIHSRLSPV
jgi:hypothetical protein